MSEKKEVEKKEDLLAKISELRQKEKIQCLNEINEICEKFKFKLEAEVIINSSGNYTNVFLHDVTK
jgi:hypothetical protein